MRKIINKLLFKMGLQVFPRNTGDDVVFTWTITHKGHNYGLKCSCAETDEECINNSISGIRGTIDNTLRELNILPSTGGQS